MRYYFFYLENLAGSRIARVRTTEDEPQLAS